MPKKIIPPHLFNIGDTISAKLDFSGFEKATITSIDEKYYHLKIMNGIATIPISAEKCYEIYDGKKKYRRRNHFEYKM